MPTETQLDRIEATVVEVKVEQATMNEHMKNLNGAVQLNTKDIRGLLLWRAGVIGLGMATVFTAYNVFI